MKFLRKNWKRIVGGVVLLAIISITGFVVHKINSKISLKTYTSPLEKLSFKYPSNWKARSSELSLPSGLKADTITLTSPTGKITISWLGAISGLGGGCDSDTLIQPGNTGCGELEVVEKDKLPNADFYFVEWLYTNDGVNYTPRFALQNGNVPNKYRTYLYVNVFTFQGKNNYIQISNEEKVGPFDAVLTGGGIFQKKDDNYFPITSKESVLKFFSDPEMLQAKQILLSASY